MTWQTVIIEQDHKNRLTVIAYRDARTGLHLVEVAAYITDSQQLTASAFGLDLPATLARAHALLAARIQRNRRLYSALKLNN